MPNRTTRFGGCFADYRDSSMIVAWGLKYMWGTTSLAVTSTSIESLKSFPQEAEELIVATERNAKLRYEGYKKLSEM